MRKTIITVALLMLAVVVAGLNGCLMEDREVEIVLNDENCETFIVLDDDENFTLPLDVELDEELDSLLADNDVSREQILDAFLVSASYEAKDFEHTHDWDLTGVVMVQRLDILDTPDTLIVYTEATVSEETVGEKTYAVLHGDGVAKVDAALDDYITGSYPRLRLTLVSGNVDPDPSPSDIIDFSWEFCIFIQMVTTLDTEIFQLF